MLKPKLTKNNNKTLKHMVVKALAMATMALPMTNANAIKVWDPTNYIQNLLSAREALKETADRAVQMRTQYQQYKAELAQLASMPAAEKARRPQI